MIKDETPKERLLHFIKAYGLSVRAFEQKINAGNSYVQSMKNGPSAKVLDRICREFPSLNRVWIVTGEGEMLKSEGGNSSSAILEIDESTNKNNSGHISMGSSDSTSLVLSMLQEQLNAKDKQIAELSSMLKQAQSTVAMLEAKINHLA